MSIEFNNALVAGQVVEGPPNSVMSPKSNGDVHEFGMYDPNVLNSEINTLDGSIRPLDLEKNDV